MGRRPVWLVLGVVLAASATAAVLLTDDARYLRVALLAVCWGFVLTAFVDGDRRADQVAAAAREAELRQAYAVELEREGTARHEYEARLEGRLRQEADGAMREYLAQLRTELAALAELRHDLGRLRSELTEQLSGELLSERMVRRAQAVRGPAQPTPEPSKGRALEVPAEPEATPRPVPARPPVPPLPARVPRPGHSRPEQILAESGVHPRAARRRHSRE